MDRLAELRRRLQVTAQQAPDELLDHFLDVAGAGIDPWIVPRPVPDPYQANIDEGVVQLAVKMWDISVKGVTGLAADGDWISPAPAATPGLVRSVFGVLGPALTQAGLSV